MGDPCPGPSSAYLSTTASPWMTIETLSTSSEALSTCASSGDAVCGPPYSFSTSRSSPWLAGSSSLLCVGDRD